MKPISRRRAALDALPVFAALVFEGVAHGRLWLTVPIAALLALGLGRVAPKFRELHLVVLGAAGAVAGLAMLLVSAPPEGPIPPAVMSPLTGFLAVATAYCAVSRNTLYAWIYGLLLAALCGNAPPSPLLNAGFAALMGAMAVAVGTRTMPRHWTGAAGFAAFMVVSTAGIYGLARLMLASEGVLMSAVYELTRDALPSGLGLQSSVSLATTSTLSTGSGLVLELEGAVPDRLRAVVLDQFDGRTWTTSPALAQEAKPLPEAAGATRELRMSVVRELDSKLPAPAGLVAVDGVSAVASGGWVARANGLQGSTVTLRYAADERLPPEPEPDATARALPPQLASDLAPFAAQIIAGAGTDRQKAEAAARHFHEHFTYSLSVDLAGKGGPLVVLLREKRPAYCVYFASAMAALLRTQGVATRVVGGFLPGERNPIDGTTTVRERDAHAWVEVWLADERGWVAFDPTPMSSRDEQVGLERAPSWLKSAWSAAGSAFARPWRAFWRSPSDALLALGKSPVLWLAIGAFVFWQWRKRKRGPAVRKQEGALETTDATLRALWSRYVRALARAGVRQSAAETDDELLDRLAAANPGLGQPARAFVGAYRAARYRPGAYDVASLDSALAAVERAGQAKSA